MFCSNCGAKNRDSANFCRRCGDPMDRSTRKSRRKKKHPFLYALLALLLIGTGFGAAQLAGDRTEEPEPVAQVANNPIPGDKTAVIKEAQAKVFTVKTEDAYGSGFLFTNGGDVVTSAHLVMGVQDVMVRDSNGLEQPGKVIGISKTHDIALVRVDALAGTEPLGIELTPAQVGSEVIALGSPSGFENTAAIGYLTGIERDFDQEYLYEDLYQIDVQMALGSSGGPLIDAASGKVIGINSLLLIESNGIGFAIPMYTMQDLLLQWATTPMTDAEIQEVFNSAEAFGTNGTVIQPSA
ncbi:trypsin-like peptidase domain-containing protein [Planococcus sp. FY231025]|uniref:trypsin-like peptidase domain-containing protein n=1 Tax=Planococcus sp. FY231025 TaxID=3455699 RepID=UPI003F92B347